MFDKSQGDYMILPITDIQKRSDEKRGLKIKALKLHNSTIEQLEQLAKNEGIPQNRFIKKLIEDNAMEKRELQIDLYFKEYGKDPETDKFIQKFSPLLQKELQYFYQKTAYSIRVYPEKFNEESHIENNQIIILFDLNDSEAGSTLLTNMVFDIERLSHQIIRYTYSLFRIFVENKLTENQSPEN